MPASQFVQHTIFWGEVKWFWRHVSPETILYKMTAISLASGKKVEIEGSQVSNLFGDLRQYDGKPSPNLGDRVQIAEFHRGPLAGKFFLLDR
jgi:hypothetical protein